MLSWRVLFLALLVNASVPSVAATIHSVLVISDIHLDSASSHRMEIAPHYRWYRNDLDLVTFHRLMKSLRHAVTHHQMPNPDAIIVLGDLVGHQRMRPDAVSFSQKASYQALADYFPGVPVLFTFGNNDAVTVNYGPFSPKNGAFLSNHSRCQAKPTHYPCALSTNRIDGYYSAYLFPRLRLISLNSVMFSPRAQGVTSKSIASQLHWLREQLALAQQHHEQVLLVMHVPPGKNTYDGAAFWTQQPAAVFLQLLKQHARSIIGVLAAHTHKDEIKRLSNSEHQPLVGVFLNAALSTSHGNAPGVRVYSFTDEKQQWQLVNYTSYYLTENKAKELSLRKLYDYKTEYCAKEEQNLTACLAHVTAEKMEKNLAAGNPHFHDRIYWPDAINLVSYH